MVVVSHTTSGLVNAGVLRDIRCSSLHGEAYRCFRRSSLVLRNAPGRNKRIVPLVMVHGTIEEVPRLSKDIDDQLSNRHIDLDPAGYFIIKVDRERKEIVAEHYTNTINKNGVACDPLTGKPIPCTPGKPREPSGTYRGASAKQLSVLLLEELEKPLVSMLVHANYLGREFQRAEAALISGEAYIQD